MPEEITDIDASTLRVFSNISWAEAFPVPVYTTYVDPVYGFEITYSSNHSKKQVDDAIEENREFFREQGRERARLYAEAAKEERFGFLKFLLGL